MDGWIKLYRKFQRNCFWLEKRRFSKAEAWLDILMSANFEDKKQLIKGKIHQFKRGEWHTSELQLAKRWRWSRNAVRAYLTLLADEKMIEKKGTAEGTALAVINYGIYQSEGTTSRTPESTTEGTTEGTQTKNIKKEKKKYASNIALTENEYNRLVTDYGQAKTDAAIQYLSDWKIEKDYKTKDDNRTLRRWVFDAVEKKTNKPTNKELVLL